MRNLVILVSLLVSLNVFCDEIDTTAAIICDNLYNCTGSLTLRMMKKNGGEMQCLKHFTKTLKIIKASAPSKDAYQMEIDSIGEILDDKQKMIIADKNNFESMKNVIKGNL